MKTTNELCSKEFKNKVENIIEEDGYEYKIIVSSTNADFYKGSNEKIISSHISHIAEDYAIDEGLELVVSNGYIKNFGVYAELLMRKEKNKG